MAASAGKLEWPGMLGSRATVERLMMSRFPSPLEFAGHEVQQRLGWFGEPPSCGRMGYFITVKKHQADAFQFARRHGWPPPKQLLNRALPGEVAPPRFARGPLRPNCSPARSANIEVAGPLTMKMGVTGLNGCHD